MTDKSLKLFYPLYSDTKEQSIMALRLDFFAMIRRFSLLYMYMFMGHQTLFQVIIFTMLSFLDLCYLLETKPYKSAKQNRLNNFNESVTLTVSYLVMSLNGICNNADQFEDAGILIARILYFTAAINGGIILYTALKELQLGICKWNFKRIQAK